MAKKIRENGIVLSKVLKPAMDSFVSNGKVVEAMPERPTVFIGCGEVDGENGITDMIVAKAVLEKEQYESLVYLQKVEVLYEYNGENKIKVLEVSECARG
jgi:hypothetical protein